MPLVSVLLSVHNDARFLAAAVESVLRQTVDDLELIVVDDASTDETPAVLSAVRDPRLRVLRNEQQLGLAASLNRGLDEAQGRYVARLDADDVALPQRLESQLARIAATPSVAAVGTAVLDLDETGRVGTLHRNPAGTRAVRWLTLFGSPFFHPTVLVDRELLDRHGLRYDPAYLESEDYELWSRLLELGDGTNLAEPLVLKRVHAGQASLRRSDLQESFQRQVALREIARIAPELVPRGAELAWRLGSGRGARGRGAPLCGPVGGIRAPARHRPRSTRDRSEGAPPRQVGPWARPRALLSHAPCPGSDAPPARGEPRPGTQPLARRSEGAAAPIRVTVVSPEPTPYRSPLFDLVAARPELELTVIYAAHTVAGRTWSVEPQHEQHVPSRTRLARARAGAPPRLSRDTRNRQGAARVQARRCRGIRLEHVRVAGRDRVVPPRTACRISRSSRVTISARARAGGAPSRVQSCRACSAVQRVRSHVGTASRDSLVERGAQRERVHIFANTIDVAEWEGRQSELAQRRPELRAELGAAADDVLLLSVARLGPEKGLDVLVRGVAAAGDPKLLLVIAGEVLGVEQIEALAQELGVRTATDGDLAADSSPRRTSAADVFALLSTPRDVGCRRQRGCRVGAAARPLGPRRCGVRPASRRRERFSCSGRGRGCGRRGAQTACRRCGLAHARGERSRELVRDWGYEPSVENFVAAVREATSR